MTRHESIVVKVETALAYAEKHIAENKLGWFYARKENDRYFVISDMTPEEIASELKAELYASGGMSTYSHKYSFKFSLEGEEMSVKFYSISRYWP